MAFVGEFNLNNVKSVIKRDWLGESYFEKYGKYAPSISIEIEDDILRDQLIANGVKVWSIPSKKDEPPKFYVTVKVDYNDKQSHVVLVDANGKGTEIHANTASMLKNIWVESVDVHAVISSTVKYGKTIVNPYSKFLVVHAMSDEEKSKHLNRRIEDNPIYREYASYLDHASTDVEELPFN